MLMATVAGRISRVKEYTFDQMNGGQITFHIRTRPYGYDDDVYVVILVRGKRATELSEDLDEETYVTCVGGVVPFNNPDHKSGKSALHMTAMKVEIMGFCEEELEGAA